jgi:adenosylhomocysteine nucleosidase
MPRFFDDASVTAVVSALPEEQAPLRARVSGLAPLRAGTASIERGRLAGCDVALCVTGDGATNARVGVAALLAALRPNALVVIGIAGGLSRELSVADVVVARRVIDEAGRTFCAEPAMLAAATSAARAGVVVSAARIADTVAEKSRLATIASSADAIAVVDLESATFVAAADDAGIPWLVLRAVSDTADESLPSLLNRSRRAGGAVSRAGVALRLFGQPSALPFLLTLRARMSRCAEALADAAAWALPALHPGARPTPAEARP